MTYFINGKPYDSLTRTVDYLEDLRKRFIVSEQDISNIPSPTPLDEYFISVADKHGIDFMEDDSQYDHDGDENE